MSPRAWHLGALAATVAVTAGGCGAADIVPTDAAPQRVPRGHLPKTPVRLESAAGPALLDTVDRFLPQRGQVHADWQTALPRLGSRHRMAYRVPADWTVDGAGRARSGDGVVVATPRFTSVREGREITLPQYLATLASGTRIQSFVTPRGYTVYVLDREVSPAPTDPEVATEIFHTAIISVGGRIAKLDITYPSPERWRFAELCPAIIGTIEVQPPLPIPPA